MILNDRQIVEHVEKYRMIEPFEPRQVKQVDDRRVISFGTSSFGYDLRVANEFKVFGLSFGGVIDPKNFDEMVVIDEVVEDHEAIVLPPHSFALARSVEYFRIPDDIVCICMGKSTYARCGIVVNVTPLEPGWEGYVTLEISNTTPLPAKIYAGEGLCQVLFLKGERPEVTYRDRNGKYQGQTGITLPRV